MNFPDDLKYTNDHEWVKIDGNLAIIGVTDHAQSELGDVVYIDIDEDLESITKGEDFGTIEAVKTVADLMAPISGNVSSINVDINDTPETVNSDPYGDGWLIKVEITDMSELDDLMDSSAYQDFVGQ